MSNLLNDYAKPVFLVLVLVQGIKKQFKLKGRVVNFIAFLIAVAVIGYEYVAKTYSSAEWFELFNVVCLVFVTFFLAIGGYDLLPMSVKQNFRFAEDYANYFKEKVVFNDKISPDDTTKAMSDIVDATYQVTPMLKEDGKGV